MTYHFSHQLDQVNQASLLNPPPPPPVSSLDSLTPSHVLLDALLKNITSQRPVTEPIIRQQSSSEDRRGSLTVGDGSEFREEEGPTNQRLVPLEEESFSDPGGIFNN